MSCRDRCNRTNLPKYGETCLVFPLKKVKRERNFFLFIYVVVSSLFPFPRSLFGLLRGRARAVAFSSPRSSPRRPPAVAGSPSPSPPPPRAVVVVLGAGSFARVWFVLGSSLVRPWFVLGSPLVRPWFVPRSCRGRPGRHPPALGCWCGVPPLLPWSPSPRPPVLRVSCWLSVI